MERTAYWFPPDADDLEKPSKYLRNAAQALQAAGQALRKIEENVHEFPAVGSERPKQEAIRNLAAVRAQYQEVEQGLAQVTQLTRGLGPDLTKAFHDPLGQSGQGQPMAVYSYDRPAVMSATDPEQQERARRQVATETEIKKGLAAAGFVPKQSRSGGDVTDYEYKWEATFGIRGSRYGVLTLQYYPNQEHS